MTTPRPDESKPADYPPLPMVLETALLRELSLRADKGASLFEHLLESGTTAEVAVFDSDRHVELRVQPPNGTVLVCDPSSAPAEWCRWKRLRSLVLRNLLLESQAAANEEELPLLCEAMRYPRPSTRESADFPALTQLVATCEERLRLSETVSFDGLLGTDQTLLGRLSQDQVAAIVQDDAFDDCGAELVPTVFPIASFDELAAAVRQANPANRSTISAVLPVYARLSVLEDRTEAESLGLAVALLYLDLTPDEVMEVFRENTLTLPASAVLAKNGTSLTELSIRQSRFYLKENFEI